MKIKLPKVTLFAVAGGNDLRETIRALRISQHYCEFATTVLCTSYVHVELDGIDVYKIQPLISSTAYCKFAVRKLNEYVHTPFVLINHADGYVLNPGAWIDEFLDYDYIGAPWSDGSVGNGGFCIRSKRLLEELSKEDYFKGYGFEDWRICHDFREIINERMGGFRIAPIELAERFSVEYHATKEWTGQFGFHSNLTDISRWQRPLLQFGG